MGRALGAFAIALTALAGTACHTQSCEPEYIPVEIIDEPVSDERLDRLVEEAGASSWFDLDCSTICQDIYQEQHDEPVYLDVEECGFLPDGHDGEGPAVVSCWGEEEICR